MKRILSGLGAIVVLLILVVLVKTLLLTSDSLQVEEVELIEVPDEALERLQGAIRFRTISYEYPATPDSAEFIGLHQYISKSFPLVDSLLEREVIADYSLLYKWSGTNPDVKPIVLMGHMDVVPVDSGTLEQWDAPPFSGEIKGDFIYGRGTMDDKVSVLSIMEAVELALQNNLQPQRTIYLAFGHDEEVGGEAGAGAIAKYLGDQGVHAEYVLDEGGYVAEGFFPGVDHPIAVINVTEKGFVSFELTIETPGGHSSNPPADNTIGSLARAISKLEDNQFPYRMTPTLEEQIEKIGAGMPFLQRIPFANTWLFGSKILEGLNARTTTAPTIIQGGVKDNVIPTSASVVVNFRIMPGESVEDVKNHINETVDDARISLKTVTNVNEPAPVSDAQSASYQAIVKSIKQVIPGAVVAPGLLGGGTDTKHYREVSDNQYRFMPLRISEENLTGLHGINERLLVSNYKEAVQFVYQLIRNQE